MIAVREAMNNNDHPITLQLTVTITALVHPEPEAGGYSAEVPALPGCYTQGETLEEVRANLREAVEGWLGSAHDSALHRRAESEQVR
jgi:predicted RNase H-like HicB family nuclease